MAGEPIPARRVEKVMLRPESSAVKLIDPLPPARLVRIAYRNRIWPLDTFLVASKLYGELTIATAQAGETFTKSVVILESTARAATEERRANIGKKRIFLA